MVNRPAAPPAIGGYTYAELIGQGGFADVFLYQQVRPARAVAIKVLLASETHGQGRDDFEAEANVMAQLSSHPSIVSIFQADVASDGRPFLVMEYCPRANLAVRCRQAPVQVPEVLEIGVRVSGAVATAHSAGILHRDIKPNNILMDAYDQPKLTDFGIASATGAGPSAGGMSVPWSPPEMFSEEPPNDPRGDVYSLGATLYTLLAGRSPFEVIGGNNDNHTLMTRIERQKPPRLTRPDLPEQLNETLERAMSKALGARHPSAIAFARALQDVQIAMHLTPTKLDVLDATMPVEARPSEDGGRTSIRPIVIIEPGTKPDRRLRRPAEPAQAAPPVKTPQMPLEQTLARPHHGPDLLVAPIAGSPQRQRELERDETSQRPDQRLRSAPTETTTIPNGDPPRRSVSRAILTAVATGVVLSLGAWTLWGGFGESANVSDDSASSGLAGDPMVDPISDKPTRPIVESGVLRDGAALFRWTNPAPRVGDTYRWREVDSATAGTESDEPTISVPIGRDGSVCIEVQVLRGGVPSEPGRACYPATGGE